MHPWNDKMKADAGVVFLQRRMGPPGVIQFQGAVMQYLKKNLQLPSKTRVKGEQQWLQLISSAEMSSNSKTVGTTCASTGWWLDSTQFGFYPKEMVQEQGVMQNLNK